MDLFSILGVEALKSLPHPLPNIFLGVIILFLTTVAWLLIKSVLSFSNAIRGNSIVICGGMDSGKTVLFYYLKSGKFRDTLPSMKENVAEFTISHPDANETSRGRYVDFPGHGSLRHKLQKHLSDAKFVIFCIDGTDLGSVPVAAKSLYDILTDKTIYNQGIPVFIACTKSDLDSFSNVDNIAKLLETEVGAVRDSREENMQGLEDNEARRTLGEVDSPFLFSQCRNETVVATKPAEDNRVECGSEDGRAEVMEEELLP